MLEPNFSPFPELKTDRLFLRETLNSDVEEVLVMRSHKTIMKYIDRPRAESLEDAYAHIKKLQTMVENNEGISWVICLKGEEKHIGNIGLWRLDKENHRAEIGYALHPDHFGKGIMTEAMKAVLDYGFNIMGLHSVEANINPENASSEKILLRNGFKAEAYFRENYYFNGKFLDSKIYCLLKTDEWN